jgi:glucose-6-phosphate isomerase
MITANLENLFAHKIGKNGISQETEHEFAQERVRVGEAVAKNISHGAYGFVNSVKHQSLKSISDYLAENKWIKSMVVIGIGGSDLGGRAIRQALASEAKTQHPHINVLFHGDSPDPADIDWLLDRIAPTNTVFNIVSKSGGTVETMIQYALFKQKMQKLKSKNWQRHFVFTTDPDEGALHKEAKLHKIKTFSIPEDVGGRYSVLTHVGLLPAMALGLDAHAMLEGARDSIKKFLEQPVNSIPMLVSWAQYLLYSQGIKTSVIMPYSARLNEFGQWYRQLWAESLGKEGKGILPIFAKGPADQHSQLQFYTQGELMSSFWFVNIANHDTNHTLGEVDIAGLEYLSGKDFAGLLNVEHQATAESLANAGRPNATITLDKLDPYTLGELFMNFELAVVCLGEFMGVNVFDQPGVEDSKQRIYAMLGRQ